MSTYAVTDIAIGGITDALAAVSSSDDFVNTGAEFLEVNNGGGSSINVTIVTPGTVDGNAIADRVVAVGAGVRKKIGPFIPSVYNDPATGKVTVQYSGTTSVTAAVYRCTKNIGN